MTVGFRYFSLNFRKSERLRDAPKLLPALEEEVGAILSILKIYRYRGKQISRKYKLVIFPTCKDNPLSYPVRCDDHRCGPSQAATR